MGSSCILFKLSGRLPPSEAQERKISNHTYAGHEREWSNTGDAVSKLALHILTGTSYVTKGAHSHRYAMRHKEYAFIYSYVRYRWTWYLYIPYNLVHIYCALVYSAWYLVPACNYSHARNFSLVIRAHIHTTTKLHELNTALDASRGDGGANNGPPQTPSVLKSVTFWSRTVIKQHQKSTHRTPNTWRKSSTLKNKKKTCPIVQFWTNIFRTTPPAPDR